MVREIVIGEIKYNAFELLDTPIELFKRAYKISKLDSWSIFTNNSQFIEALEVLCGEENIKIYLRLNGKCEEVDFLEAYNYLGDVYDIINRIRIKKDLGGDITDEWVNYQVKKYNEKYLELMGDEKLLKIKKLKSSDPISYEEWVQLHNDVDGVI